MSKQLTNWLDQPITLEEVQKSVGPGWSGLIAYLVDSLFDLGWNGKVIQVKEKFGGLRFYINDYSEPIFRKIAEVEQESFRVCENCGSRQEVTVGCKPQTGGWIVTWCKECRDGITNTQR